MSSSPDAVERLTELNPLHAENRLSFPTLGISIDGIEAFVELLGGFKVLSDETTAEISIKFVKPMTKTLNCSYCSYVQVNKPEMKYVDRATVFISHAWGYKFKDVLEALMTYNFPPDTYLWFDLFSNNQHLTDEPPPFDWWQSTFRNAIKQMKNVVMVAEPWDNPITLTRSWCLWEVFCAASLGNDCTFNIAMSKREESRFIAMAGNSASKFYDMLGNVDVRQSRATNPNDQKLIFEVVARTIGFVKLNEMVLHKLSEWVVAKFRDYVVREEKLSFRTMSSPDVENVGMEPKRADSAVLDIESFDSKVVLAELLGRSGQFEEGCSMLSSMISTLVTLNENHEVKFMKAKCLLINTELKILAYGSDTFNSVNPVKKPAKEFEYAQKLYHDVRQNINDSVFLLGQLLFPELDYLELERESNTIRDNLNYSCSLCCKLCSVSCISSLIRYGSWCCCICCYSSWYCCQTWSSLKQRTITIAVQDNRENKFTSLLLKGNADNYSSQNPSAMYLEWYMRAILVKAKLLSMNLQESPKFSMKGVQLLQLYHSRNIVEILEIRRYHATIMFNNGRCMSALREYEDILSKQKEILSATHPLIVFTLVALADTYNQLDQLSLARQYYRQAITLLTEKFGSKDKHTDDVRLRYNKMEASFGNVYRAAIVYSVVVYRRLQTVMSGGCWNMITNICLLLVVVLMFPFMLLMFYLFPTMLRVFFFGWIPMKNRATVYKYIGFTRRHSDYYRAFVFWIVWIVGSAIKAYFALIVIVFVLFIYLLLTGNLHLSGGPEPHRPTFTPTAMPTY